MILVIAGTSDARELAIEIDKQGYQLITSVVTENAAKSLTEARLPVRVGRLAAIDMVDFIKEHQITLIVDASHPFAEEASRNAIEAAERSDTPYIRYERKEITSYDAIVTKVASYEEAADVASNHQGVVMLTTGSKTLPTFAQKLVGLEGVRFLARMLPRKDNLELCEQLGIEQKNIIAIQGPFSKELNKALYRQYGVTLMITKESGKVGSVDEKVEAARELGIPIVMIQRPRIGYGNVYSDIPQVVEQIKKIKKV
ncbi:precorrin-6A reductase [Desertibacillus haloalkaliphilus]|uniref:precorrin-6A reductase n=1 Tax=Desertibacillus haloalkaliphilus TaxID=1328930 RepID=UPI001C252B22|nr:precorrin-6A reductase [Desertibacillus haloalkaliphilus]MBU8907809.1 precorrin-6A reductase [Desertibacillus haloalkaliphilus]